MEIKPIATAVGTCPFPSIDKELLQIIIEIYGEKFNKTHSIPINLNSSSPQICLTKLPTQKSEKTLKTKNKTNEYNIICV